MKTFKSEEEFAEIIVKWLKENNWTVYQEVQLNRYAGGFIWKCGKD